MVFKLFFPSLIFFPSEITLSSMYTTSYRLCKYIILHAKPFLASLVQQYGQHTANFTSPSLRQNRDEYLLSLVLAVLIPLL